MTTTLPTTVCLFGCPAYRDGREITVSGLWDTVEFFAYEPAAYVSAPGWLLIPHGSDDADDPAGIYVDDYVFREQVWPDAYGRELALEREMDLAEENREREEARR
jgi:hypothetical protein